LKPADRYATPETVMRALLPFLKPDLQEHSAAPPLLANSSGPDSHLGSASDTHGRRVLIVDDQASIREFCRCVLEPEGFQCADAVDGEQGLELANAEPFELVLLDIDMPKMFGSEVLRRLRERPPRPHL